MKTINDIIKETAKLQLAKRQKIEEERKEDWLKRFPKGGEYSPEYVPKDTTQQEEIDSVTHNMMRSIPKRYENVEIPDEEFYTTVIDALKERKGLYLYGPAGTGKTHLLYVIYKMIRARSSSVRIWNVPTMLSKIRMEYDKDGEGESGVEDWVKTDSITLFDDFGVEKQTEWNTEMMYRLINYRYEKMIPTFFASNLSLQKLAEKSGDRISSRIAEMCKVIAKDGKDRRVK